MDPWASDAVLCQVRGAKRVMLLPPGSDDPGPTSQLPDGALVDVLDAGEILFLPAAEARQLRISEPSLRKLTAALLWNQQREQWKTLRSIGVRRR